MKRALRCFMEELYNDQKANIRKGNQNSAYTYFATENLV